MVWAACELIVLNILELYKLDSKTSGHLKSDKVGVFTPEELQTLQKAFFFSFWRRGNSGLPVLLVYSFQHTDDAKVRQPLVFFSWVIGKEFSNDDDKLHSSGPWRSWFSFCLLTWCLGEYCLVMWANVFWENKGENWNNFSPMKTKLTELTFLYLNISRWWEVPENMIFSSKCLW